MNIERIDICEVLQSKKTYKKEFKKRYEFVKQNIGLEHCFDSLFHVYLDDGSIVEMDLADYLINLMMWQPCIAFGLDCTLDYLFPCDNITGKTIKNYIDNKYVRQLRTKVNLRKLNIECMKIIENLKRIVEDFGIILNVSYCLHTIIKLRRKHPELNSIIYSTIPEGMQPHEIEELGKSKLKQLVNILSNSDTGFKALLNCKAAIKEGQLQELMVLIGNKPNLEGNVEPVPIDTNIMFKGLNTPSNYYMDATGGRKALIMNKKYTGSSGYFSRKLNLLAMDLEISKTTKDCHTTALVKFVVEDEICLARIEGKYYRLKPRGIMHCASINDTHLIGRTIYLRSAVKCKCKDGICRTCYGELADINRDINIGIFGASAMSSRFTQAILSAKHSLMTKSQKIELGGSFDEYFILDGNQIIFDSNIPLSSIEDLYIKISSDDLSIDLDEYSLEYASTNYSAENSEDEDGEFITSEELLCSKIYITDDEGNVIHTIKEKNDCMFNVTDYLYKLMENKKYRLNSKNVLIPMCDLEEDSLFSIDINNAELNKTLNLIKDLLEKDDHQGCETVDELLQKFNRLLIEGELDIQLVHMEIIIRNLVRSQTDPTRLPDYENDEPYMIYTVKKALMRHPSPLVSIAFERVKEQIKGVLLFRKRGCSMFDKLFMEKYCDFYDLDKKDLIS